MPVKYTKEERDIDYILARLESKIDSINPFVGPETETLTGEMSAETMKSLCLTIIRDTRIAAYSRN